MNVWLKRILAAVVVVGVVGAAGAYGYFQAMKRAWIRFDPYDIRTEGSLKVGDLAPDIELARADGSGSMSLSEAFSERPAVLVFGSYT